MMPFIKSPHEVCSLLFKAKAPRMQAQEAAAPKARKPWPALLLGAGLGAIVLAAALLAHAAPLTGTR